MTPTPPHGLLSCDDAKRLLPLYIDRECSADDAAVVADHLVGCEPCAEEAATARALRSTLREACREAAAPLALRDRIRSSLRLVERPSLARRASWAASIAVAASIVGVIVFLPSAAESPISRRPTTHNALASAPRNVGTAEGAAVAPVARNDSFARAADAPSSFPLVRVAARSGPDSPAAPAPNRASAPPSRHAEEIARRHDRPTTLDIASPDPAAVSRFLERRLHVAIPLPPGLTRGGQLLGARVTDLTEARAAQVLFHKDGHKLSLFAVPNEDSPADSNAADATRNISFLRAGPVNVVQWERGAVRFALASNLDANEMLRLVRGPSGDE